jgi:hypothetical protein
VYTPCGGAEIIEYYTGADRGDSPNGPWCWLVVGRGELCATGYTMSQAGFGAHETAQRSISATELRAGLSFGSLAELDPFEEPEGIAPHLTDV